VPDTSLTLYSKLSLKKQMDWLLLGLEENRASLVVVKSRIDSVEMRYLKSIWNFTLLCKRHWRVIISSSSIKQSLAIRTVCSSFCCRWIKKSLFGLWCCCRLCLFLHSFKQSNNQLIQTYRREDGFSLLKNKDMDLNCLSELDWIGIDSFFSLFFYY
jgi:hypothetical protein